ncbi:MAG: hypothetical protein MRJ65_01660 [Candidatus Brocadiaceae bacterium]|nr:hypothetical protein [Candidatus Brocadiaceae bacterium]
MDAQDNLSKGNSMFLGVAFDNKDNHKRITTGENFYIYGGSTQTHENIVEKVLSFNAIIKKYGKKLDDLSISEFYEIVGKINADPKKIYWHFHV